MEVYIQELWNYTGDYRQCSVYFLNRGEKFFVHLTSRGVEDSYSYHAGHAGVQGSMPPDPRGLSVQHVDHARLQLRYRWGHLVTGDWTGSETQSFKKDWLHETSGWTPSMPGRYKHKHHLNCMRAWRRSIRDRDFSHFNVTYYHVGLTSK